MVNPAFDNDKLKDILEMEDESPQGNAQKIGEKEGVTVKPNPFEFDLKPIDLEKYLNKYVVSQEDSIEVIATKVCTHFNKMAFEKKLTDVDKIIGSIKSNMLLIGPTGVGKTYIIKLIAQKIGVPFVKADATKFSETGYVGGDVEDLVRELVQEADGNVEKAEYGIIYLDEIDKIASSGSGRGNGPDVSRAGVQRNLLKLMEEADVDLKTPHDLASQVEAAMEAQKTGKVDRKKINTKNILFIVSGAFSGLDEIISKRLSKQSIGFGKDKLTIEDKRNLLLKLKTEDLLEYGFESEFIGRLPVSMVLNELDEKGLYRILKNDFSTVVLGKKMDFKSYGIDLTFTDDALKILAERAYKEKTGARGLLSVFEKVLIKFEKSLPSSDIKELVVDKEVVLNPQAILKEMLADDGVHHFQKEFLIDHGVYLEFNDDAVEKIKIMADEQTLGVSELCEKMFKDYYHGIRLMKLENFTITYDAIVNPDKYINEYIKENFIKE